MNKLFEQVGELIGKDDLRGAITLLHFLLKNSPKLDEVILQSARLSDVMKQIRLGVVEFQQANVTKNQIRFGVLDLLREIEICSEQNPSLLNDSTYLTPTITQISSGSGDNVGRDKYVYGKI